VKHVPRRGVREAFRMNCPSSALMATRFHGIIGDDKLYFNLLIRETTNHKILFIL